MMSTARSFLKTSFSALLCSVLVVQPALMEAARAQDIIIDPNGNVGMTRLQTGTTAPVVNIARPNTQGVSHNRYERFGTSSGDAVLNNSATSAHTSAAGRIEGNPNLSAGTASTIVNEVTSSQPTELKKRLEVAGDRANVVVANPNGVTCQGCSFRNTDNVTLSTGIPVIDGGTVRLDVTDGTVRIGRQGMDGARWGVSEVNLIGRRVVIDGKVTATGTINAQGGAQSYNLTTSRRAAGLTGATTADYDFAVDGTAFGAMEAGRIQVVGNEQGLGVRLRGSVNASAEDVSVSAPGRVEISTATAERNIGVRSTHGTVAVDRDLSAWNGRVSVTSREALEFGDRAGIYAGSGIILQSTHRELQATGDLQSDTDISISGRSLSFGAYASAGETVSFSVQHGATLDGATVVAERIDGTGFGNWVSLSNSAFFSAHDLPITTGRLSFGRNVIIDGLYESDSSRLVAEVSGDFRNSADMRLHPTAVITYGGDLYNEESGILSDVNLNLTRAGAIHNHGIIHGDQRVVLNAAGFFNHETGAVLSAEIRITSTGDLINKGTLVSEKDLRLTAANTLSNDGFIQADRSWFSADTIRNLGRGDLRIETLLEMTAGSELVNQGAINTLGTTTLLSEGSLTNAGLVLGEGSVTLRASELSNSGSLISGRALLINGRDGVSNTGIMASYGRMVVDSATRTTNSGSMVAETELQMRGPLFSNIGDDALVRTANGRLDTARIFNSGKIFLIDQFRRQGNIDHFENHGIFASANRIMLSGRDSNSSLVLGADSRLISGLQPDDPSQTLVAGQVVDLDFARLTMEGPGSAKNSTAARISAGGGIILATPGLLTVSGLLDAQGGGVVLNGSDILITETGSIHAAGGGRLASARGLVNHGRLVTGGQLNLASGFERLVNTGIISIGQTGSFTLTGGFDNSGFFSSDLYTSINAGRIDNSGHLQAGTSLTLVSTGNMRLTGTTAAEGAITISANELVLGDASPSAAGSFLVGTRLTLAASRFTNRGTVWLSGSAGNHWTLSDRLTQEGFVHSTGGLNVTAPRILLAAGSVISSEGGLMLQGAAGVPPASVTLAGAAIGRDITIRNVTGATVQASSAVSATNDISILTPGSISVAGQVSAGGRLGLEGQSISVSGKLFGDRVHATSATGITLSGSGYAGADLTFNAEGTIRNQGHLSSAGTMRLTTFGQIVNEAGGQVEATRLWMTAGNNLVNQGMIFGAEQARLRSTTLDNRTDAEIRAGKLDFRAETWAKNAGRMHAFGVFGEAGHWFQNSGVIRADEVVAITTRDQWIGNTETGRIHGKIIGLGATTGLNNSGTIGQTSGSTLPRAEHVRLSSGAALTNNGTIRSRDIDLTGASFTNDTGAVIAATDVLKVFTTSGGFSNAGTMAGQRTAVSAALRVNNDGRITGRDFLGLTSRQENILNSATLEGRDIVLVAENGWTDSRTGITAGNILSIKAKRGTFDEVLRGGSVIAAEMTDGGLVLGKWAVAPTVSLRVAGTLAGGANSVRGNERTQIIAGNIRRTDTDIAHRKLGVLPNNAGDIYVELTDAGFGKEGDHGNNPNLAPGDYERVNINASGQVEILAPNANLLLSGSITAGQGLTLQSGRLTALRDVRLTAATQIHLEGRRYLKNNDGVTLSTPDVRLHQRWGWFYTSDWLSTENIDHHLSVAAHTIIVNSDHRFVNRDVTLRARDGDIIQRDRVISARRIEYVAGRDILISFDPFDWRADNFTDFRRSYDISPSLFWRRSDDNLNYENTLERNRTALANADTSNWWSVTSAGLRGNNLLAQGGGISLAAGRDLTLRSGKMHSETAINLIAARNFLSEPVYIENTENNRPVGVGWSFNGLNQTYGSRDNGHAANLVTMRELRAYENQIFARHAITISAGNHLGLIGTKVESRDRSITLETADGGITMLAAPGFWAYNYERTTTKRRLGIYKSQTTLMVDRYRDIYKPTTLIASKGDVLIQTTGRLNNGTAGTVDTPNAGNAIMSAGSVVTGRNVTIRTSSAHQSILLGTYDYVVADEVSSNTNRSLFRVVPFGSSSSTQTDRVVLQNGNAMLANEILTLKSAKDLEIVGGSFAGQTVSVSAAGNLDIRAAINTSYSSRTSRVDNMVTITTINGGHVRDFAELPRISSVRPVSFTVGGDVTINGYRGPSLNDLLINSVSTRQFDTRLPDNYTAADSSGATDLVEDHTGTYVYQLPTGGDYGYLRTLLREHNATYEEIRLRDQTWYDKQVTLNPAFQAFLAISVSWATGGLGVGSSGGWWSAAQKAAVDSFATSAIGGGITGNFDPGQALKNAFLAGAGTYVTQRLTAGLNLGSQDQSNPYASNFKDRFKPIEIRNRIGQQVVSHGVGNITSGQAPFSGLDRLGRSFLVSESMAIVQNGIGDLGKGNKDWAGSFPHLMLHGGTGCLSMLAMGGNCAAGFFSAASYSILSGTELSDREKSSLISVVGALPGYLLSGGNPVNVSHGALIAQSAFEYNYLTRSEVADLISEYDECNKTQGGCSPEELNTLKIKYEGISEKNNLDLLACPDRECVEYHRRRAMSLHESWQLLGSEYRNYVELTDVFTQTVPLTTSTLDESFANRAALNSFVASHCNAGDLSCINAARDAWKTGIALGMGALAGMPYIPAAARCLAAPACRTQLSISFAEAAVGDALGGATLAPTVTVAGTTLVIKNGDRVASVVDSLTNTRYPVIGQTSNGGYIVRMPDGSNGIVTDIYRPIAPNTGTGAIRNDLIDGLPAGTRITPENVVDIRKLPDGRTVWLETGNDAAGLQHIYRRHEADFANKGIPREQVPTVVMDALQQGNIIGTNGSANVYRIVHNGAEQHIAIGVGSNGFVVRANPVSQWRPLP